MRRSNIVIGRSQTYEAALDSFGPIDILEDQPRLDLRALAANGFLREGELTELRLVWDKPRLDCYLSIGLREDERPFLTLLVQEGTNVTQQIIGLTPRPAQGRHRYRFMIQDYGSAEVLAYRFRRFAPARLQRLVHQSQRKPPDDPAVKLDAALLKRAAARARRRTP